MRRISATISGGIRKPNLVRSPGHVPETSYPVLLIALLPDVEERPRDSKKPAGLTDVAAQTLRMLQHAQPGVHLSCLDMLVSRILRPEPPVVGCENNSPVRDVYWQLHVSQGWHD
jgi:hypothetical protein